MMTLVLKMVMMVMMMKVAINNVYGDDGVRDCDMIKMILELIVMVVVLMRTMIMSKLPSIQCLPYSKHGFKCLK